MCRPYCNRLFRISFGKRSNSVWKNFLVMFKDYLILDPCSFTLTWNWNGKSTYHS